MILIRNPIRAFSVILDGRYWPDTCDHSSRSSADGAMGSAGCATTARLVDHCLPWLSWWASTRDVSDSSVAVAAGHAGSTYGPDVLSVGTQTITVWQP